MDATVFLPTPQQPGNEAADVFIQGTHHPAELVRKSGVWLHSAGSAMLSQSTYRLLPQKQTLWLILEEGQLCFEYATSAYDMIRGNCIVIPPNFQGCSLTNAKDARLLWFTLDGGLSPAFLRQMNAFNRLPARQGILPTQILLIQQIIQVLVRHNETDHASYQLNQLLWGLIAAHSGQSVSRENTLSHEISRVVDTLRSSQYHKNFSLSDMAATSRMPMETFRKRFSAELGIPPLAYLQFLKMERAKTLLRSGVSVRLTGVEIGMPDPYHFSKQFKHVVGLSPTAYIKHIGGYDELVRR